MVAMAHRLSAIKDANCIYVFEGGKVRQAGTHAEPVALGGLYADVRRVALAGFGQAGIVKGNGWGQRRTEVEYR